jgi:hypothetical protein
MLQEAVKPRKYQSSISSKGRGILSRSTEVASGLAGSPRLDDTRSSSSEESGDGKTRRLQRDGFVRVPELPSTVECQGEFATGKREVSVLQPPSRVEGSQHEVAWIGVSD